MGAATCGAGSCTRAQPRHCHPHPAAGAPRRGGQGCTWATAVMSCRVSALGGPQWWQPFTHLWQGGRHPWGRGGRGIPGGIYVPSRLCPPRASGGLVAGPSVTACRRLPRWMAAGRPGLILWTSGIYYGCRGCQAEKSIPAGRQLGGWPGHGGPARPPATCPGPLRQHPGSPRLTGPPSLAVGCRGSPPCGAAPRTGGAWGSLQIRLMPT